MQKAKGSPNAFAEFIRDQLSELDDLVMKHMFGGVGLYRDGVFFGIIYSDRLYFRVSDDTIDEFKKRTMKPFRPFAGKPASSRYYEVPLEILESPEDLVKWARKAAQ